VENLEGISPTENQRGRAPVGNNLRMPDKSCSRTMPGPDGEGESDSKLVIGQPAHVWNASPDSCSFHRSPSPSPQAHRRATGKVAIPGTPKDRRVDHAL
jgi:hypothetical protein